MRLCEYAKTKLYIKEGTKEFCALIDDYNNNCRIPNTYKMRYTDAWCATFVSICLTHCGYGKIYNSVECNQMYSKMKAYTISKKNAKVNDIVFYSWKRNNNLEHVGIIVQRSNNVLTVIEGNKNNSVNERVIGVYDGFISHIVSLPSNNDSDNITKIARDVIKGKYGNGNERKKKLESAGYNYSEVQARVEQLLGNNKTNLTTVAKDVIKGKYGNGETRKIALKKAGYNPTEVQKIVDKLLSK